MFIRITAALFFLNLSTYLVYAQQSYKPLESDNNDLIAKSIDDIISQNEQLLSKLSKDQKKTLGKAYSSRASAVIKNLEDSLFYANNDLNQYINTILGHITAKNPSIPSKELRLYVSRAALPNAYCVGEGTIVINIGLLSRLKNESQLAFVISHEIAHYTLNHVDNSLKKKVRILYSEATKEELKKISKSEFGQVAKAQELLRGIIYEDNRHSRLYESEADSLAMVYLSNTRYNLSEAYNCLAIIDTVDQPKYLYDIEVDKVFNSEGHPFDSTWLIQESSFIKSKSEENLDWEYDSLKTHPDCKKRIAYLKQRFSNISQEDKTNFLQDKKLFSQIVYKSDFEKVENYYLKGNYGKALYTAFQLLNIYPNNAYLHSMVGKNMYKIYIAQKNHVLGKSVALPSQAYIKSYNDILIFIYNLRLRDIKKIAHSYMSEKSEFYGDDEEFLYAQILTSSLIKDNEAELESLTKKYSRLFPDGKYLKSINLF